MAKFFSEKVMDSLLKKLYYSTDSPVCYSGVSKLYKEARKKLPKIKIKDVKKFLSKQQTYTLHRPVRRKFPRNKIITAGLDVDWQADLARAPLPLPSQQSNRTLLDLAETRGRVHRSNGR